MEKEESEKKVQIWLMRMREKQKKLLPFASLTLGICY